MSASKHTECAYRLWSVVGQEFGGREIFSISIFANSLLWVKHGMEPSEQILFLADNLDTVSRYTYATKRSILLRSKFC